LLDYPHTIYRGRKPILRQWDKGLIAETTTLMGGERTLNMTLSQALKLKPKSLPVAIILKCSINQYPIQTPSTVTKIMTIYSHQFRVLHVVSHTLLTNIYILNVYSISYFELQTIQINF
jgi:hypothetical protein